MAFLKLLPLLPLLCLPTSTATTPDDLPSNTYDYPSADPPEPSKFKSKSKPCPACPWNREELGQYPTPFNAKSHQYKPIHRGKYFDVYGHWMETRYSEVFWTAQPSIPLPEEIRTQFSGRAISITGFEVDVVAGGMTKEEPEWSVPEYEVYNHHYFLTLSGKDAKMTKMGARAQDSLLHNPLSKMGRHAIEVHPPEWEPRDIRDTNSSAIPTAHLLAQGNGGEHRKSFKHLPRGTGQLLQSPQSMHLQPMLINTNYPWGESPRQAFHNATLPRNSQSPPGANYSGLLECPCTTRTTKIITGFEARSKSTCGAKGLLNDKEECFGAASELVGDILRNATLDDARYPSGCYLVASSKGTEAFFNGHKDSPARCGMKDGVPIRSMGVAGVVNGNGRIGIRLELDEASALATMTLTGPADAWFGIGFNASAMADLPYTITVEGPNGTVTERALGNHEPGSQLESSITIRSNTVGPAPAQPPLRMNHVGTPIGEDVGAGSWKECRDICRDKEECDAWTFSPTRFTTSYTMEQGTCRVRSADSLTTTNAEGFTSDGWIDGMWSGVIDKSGDQSLVRTIVLTRPLKGITDSHYSFDPSLSSIPYIEAVGTSTDFGYHGSKGRGGGSIVMVETGAPICICRGQDPMHLSGSINGIPWDDSCKEYPETTIRRDNNPSCSIETYEGGMMCCHHGIFLLDADQEIPAPTFKFRMKFRFWYEDPEAVAAPDATVGPSVSQLVYPGLDYQNSFMIFRETEIAHGEYDVPPCAPGTPVEDCVHTIEGHFQIGEGMKPCQGRADLWCAPVVTPNQSYPQSQHIALLHISTHCHGPACISMEMINMDTNETICYSEPYYGVSDQAMDEVGYAAGIPPCLWGSPEEGLPFPPILHLKTNIKIVKKVNSTVGHRGVMAHWQMRGIWAADPSTDAEGKNNDEEVMTI